MYLQIHFQVLEKHIKSKRDKKFEAQMDVTVSKVDNTDLIIVTIQHTLKLFSFLYYITELLSIGAWTTKYQQHRFSCTVGLSRTSHNQISKKTKKILVCQQRPLRCRL